MKPRELFRPEKAINCYLTKVDSICELIYWQHKKDCLKRRISSFCFSQSYVFVFVVGIVNFRPVLLGIIECQGFNFYTNRLVSCAVSENGMFTNKDMNTYP